MPDLVIAFTCTPAERPWRRVEAIRHELELGDGVAAVLRVAERRADDSA